VIVADLDLVNITVAPDKADAPLVVDADAVLAFALAREALEPIARRTCKLMARKALARLASMPAFENGVGSTASAARASSRVMPGRTGPMPTCGTTWNSK